MALPATGATQPRERSRLLSAVLSIVIPGLGQLYNGEAVKALLCAVGSYLPLVLSQRLGGMLWGAIREGSDLTPGSAPFWTLLALRGVLIAISLVVWIYAVANAWRTARA